MACYIFGAGSFYGLDRCPRADDFIIAADGGWLACRKTGITPDLLLGDFDSLSTQPDFPNILRVPVEKDDTDTMLAVKTGLERGETEFHIYGGMGAAGRTTPSPISRPCCTWPGGGSGLAVWPGGAVHRRMRRHRHLPRPGPGHSVRVLPGSRRQGRQHPGRPVSPAPRGADGGVPPRRQQPLCGPSHHRVGPGRQSAHRPGGGLTRAFFAFPVAKAGHAW